jgi:hypothetical protein
MSQIIRPDRNVIKTHNYYTVVIDDSATGEHRELHCPNVITQNFFGTARGNPGYFILGSGTGTPSDNDTVMFSYVRNLQATNETREYDGFLKIRRRWVSTALQPTDNVGTVFSELGMSSSSGSNPQIYSHALIRDEAGNPTTILKTNTMTLQFIYTLYVDTSAVNRNLPAGKAWGDLRWLPWDTSWTFYPKAYNSPDYANFNAQIARTGQNVGTNSGSYTLMSPTTNVGINVAGVMIRCGSYCLYNEDYTTSVTGTYKWQNTSSNPNSVNFAYPRAVIESLTSVRFRQDNTGAWYDIPVNEVHWVKNWWGSRTVTFSNSTPADVLPHSAGLGAIAGQPGNWFAFINVNRDDPVESWWSGISRLFTSDDLVNWTERFRADLPEVYPERYIAINESSPGSSQEMLRYYIGDTNAPTANMYFDHTLGYYGQTSSSAITFEFEGTFRGYLKDGLTYTSGGLTFDLAIN